MAEDQAKSERRSMDLAQSIAALETVYQKEPAKIAPDLAQAYLTDGRPKDAIRVLKKSGNGKLETQILLAQAFFDSFQNAKAAHIITNAAKDSAIAENAGAQLLLGELALESEKFDDAKAYLHSALRLNPSNPRPAELLRNLGVDVKIPEPEDEQEQLRGFNTNSESQKETPARVLIQVLLALLLLAGGLQLYAENAHLDFEAKSLAIEAIPLLESGDVISLRLAQSYYQDVDDMTGETPYSVAGLAFLHSLLWVNHGIEDSKEYALFYTNQAKAEDIDLSNRYGAEMLVAIGEGKLDEAMKVINFVNHQGGVSDKLHWGKGLVFEAQGNIPLAQIYYKKAHDLNGKVPYFSASLGDSYNTLNDNYKAGLYWSKARASASRYLPGASRALRAKVLQGAPRSEIERRLQRLRRSPAGQLGDNARSAIALTAAELAYREGDIAAALAQTAEGLAISEADPELLRLKGLAQIASASGDSREATIEAGLANLQAVYNAVPLGTRYLHTLVDAYNSSGKHDETIKLLTGLTPPTNVKAENPMETASIQTKLGDAYVLKEDYKNADKAFKKALDLQTDYPRALLGIAVALSNQLKYNEALAAFEKAVAADSNFPEIYEKIGLMFLAQATASDAHTQLEEAHRLYRVRKRGKRELAAYYNRLIPAFEAKGQRDLAAIWKKHLAALKEEPKPTPKTK